MLCEETFSMYMPDAEDGDGRAGSKRGRSSARDDYVGGGRGGGGRGSNACLGRIEHAVGLL